MVSVTGSFVKTSLEELNNNCAETFSLLSSHRKEGGTFII